MPDDQSVGSGWDWSKTQDELGLGGEGGSGGGGLTPAVETTGTVEITPDPITGEDNITVVTVPAETTVLAIAVEGDTYPRLMLVIGEQGGLYLGNGTLDPYNENGIVFSGSPGRAQIDPGYDTETSARGKTDLAGDVRVTGGGHLILGSEGSGPPYRLKVSAEGVLSTELTEW